MDNRANEVVKPTETAERKITFSREYSVSLPKSEEAYVIAASEWDRIKRLINAIVPTKNWFVVAASICAGMFVSAVFCLIGFAPSWDSVPTWAKAITGSVAASAFVLCICLFYLDTQQRTDIRHSTSDITREMEGLEKSARESNEQLPSGV